MHRGYTKRWRKRWDKGYHYDSDLWLLMDYFIDHANHKNSNVYFPNVGVIPVKRGQHIFGTPQLSDFLRWDRGRTRRKLKILKSIGFLTIKTTNKYSIATVIKYDTYNPQGNPNDHQNDKQTTSRRPADDQQMTTPKEYKEYKEYKEKSFPDYQTIIREAIVYLNQQAGVKFNPAIYATETIMVDRINEGATLDDFKAVIKKKTSQWLNDEKMAGNLAPTTLFASDKFEKYLQEANRNGSGKKPKTTKLTGTQLLNLGFDILDKFGCDKFNEFCLQNELSKADINVIQDKHNRETANN